MAGEECLREERKVVTSSKSPPQKLTSRRSALAIAAGPALLLVLSHSARTDFMIRGTVIAQRGRSTALSSSLNEEEEAYSQGCPMGHRCA